MSNKPIKNNFTRTIVISCIALVIGILLCCSVSLGQLLSWFIGIAVALCGVMYVVNSILQKNHKNVMNNFKGTKKFVFFLRMIHRINKMRS